MARPVQVALLPAPALAEGVEVATLLDGSVESRRQEVLAALGLPAPAPIEALQPDQPRLLLRADAALSRLGLRDFLAKADRDATFALGGQSGPFHQRLSLGMDAPLAVFLQPGGGIAPERIAAAPPLIVDPQERVLRIPMVASQFGQDHLLLPLTERALLPTAHYLQLLWANLLLMPPFLWGRLLSPHLPLAILRLLWGVLSAGSVDPRAIAGALNRVGRGARIHPTAVVEGCVLGPGAVIGAHAVVRSSVLGPGAQIEDLAFVDTAILGPGAIIRPQAMIKYAVLGPRAIAGGSVQMGVLDQDAAVKHTAALPDQALGGPVFVTVNGARVEAPFGLAGSRVGARSVVGAAVLVAPGRALPPDLSILPDPALVLRGAPPGLRGRAIVRGGTLEPL